MASPDSSFTKRPVPKKRLSAGIGEPPDVFKQMASDISGGYAELKRQGGAAVENVKESYRKIKRAIAP